MAEKEPSAAGAASEDTKAKFREALERKKAAGHRSAEGADNTGSVHGPETSGSSQRMFRRKSGG
ncbi:MAG: DUF5302 domain-containing protein [Actinomycetota bacterium]|nr:DUF5302 domain-containing protein [Actinomycetota bacterium]